MVLEWVGLEEKILLLCGGEGKVADVAALDFLEE